MEEYDEHEAVQEQEEQEHDDWMSRHEEEYLSAPSQGGNYE